VPMIINMGCTGCMGGRLNDESYMHLIDNTSADVAQREAEKQALANDPPARDSQRKSWIKTAGIIAAIGAGLLVAVHLTTR